MCYRCQHISSVTIFGYKPSELTALTTGPTQFLCVGFAVKIMASGETNLTLCTEDSGLIVVLGPDTAG